MQINATIGGIFQSEGFLRYLNANKRNNKLINVSNVSSG